jgi:hypothetical protein
MPVSPGALRENHRLFCQPNGEYFSPDRVGARVVEALRKAGLAGVSLHSHASTLLSKGVPIAVVADRLGHADQNITLSIYSHAIPADTKAAAKIWNDAMADLVRTDRKPGHIACEQMLAGPVKMTWIERNGGDDGARTRKR